MRIAIVDHIDQTSLELLLSENIIYRPDAMKKGQRYFGKFLRENNVGAIVTSSVVDEHILVEWSSGSAGPSYLALYGGAFVSSDLVERAQNTGLCVIPSNADGASADIFTAFQSLEKRFSGDQIAHPARTKLPCAEMGDVTFV